MKFQPFKRGVFVLTALFFHLAARAQEETTDQEIRGVVYQLSNQADLPLPGASVSVVGESTGTVTDLDGKFILKVKGDDIQQKTLLISHVGMNTHTESIGNQSQLTIYLEPIITQLDQIVITSSYGTSKPKEEVVGSITTLSSKELAPEQPVATFDELLEGAAAGILVEVNPVLGGATAIDIRGQGSLTPLSTNSAGSSTQPLIIVDGVILSEEISLEGNNFFDRGFNSLSEDLLNPLAKIGIDNIESFSILKDAAAVGLYGADAANGVIIITTKSGIGRDFSLNASMQTGITTSFNRFKYLNGEQYQSVLNALYTNSGETNNVREWDGVDTNWFDLLNRNGSFWRYNVSGFGAIKNWRIRAGIGYQKTNEAQRENTFEKLNSLLSVDYSKDKFDLRFRIAPSLVVKNAPNTLYAYALPPTISLYDDKGSYTYIATYGNPVAVSRQNTAKTNTTALLSSLKLDYELTEEWNVSALVGLDLSFKDQDRFFSGLNGTGNFRDGTQGRRLIRDRDTQKWNWNSTITFNPTLSEAHHVDAIAGVELRGERVDFSFARGDGFDNFATIQPVSLAEEQDYETDYSTSTARSFFSQGNYNYKSKYFFLVNFRIDQSSVFGGDNNTAYNGGVGASWNVSREDFLKNSALIDFLRLRTSYGRTGNSRIGAYTAVGLFNVSNGPLGYQSEDQYATIDRDFAPNDNLGWEVNKKFNIGVDVDFLNQFSFIMDFFRDQIEDQIVARDVIAESGYNTARINGANMYNQGFEWSLIAHWVSKGAFSWRSSFNLTRIRNKVTSLTGLESDFSPSYLARSQIIGHSTSALWGFRFAGIDPATGRELFLVNGEVHDAEKLNDQFNNTDWEPIGDTQPDFYGGFNNTITFKGLTLNVIMSYSYGGDVLINRSFIDGYNDLAFRNTSLNIYYDAWQAQGDQAALPILVQGNPITHNSSKYVYDNSHIKLKSVSLSYRFPVEKLNLPVKTLDIGLNGSNLHYWFREKSPNGRNGVAELRNPYPEMRSFTLSINTTF
ncbi:MAG: SusC/RagA family TonB-linked outer membrane protein [Ekhidna sp.]|nr:SusC/RagA family TonB-linked outer membrane protein [Ekhidna sp.]MBC6410030.1 SusC/RagA family TonB-linked outer membrane protein [Ekhidna sp.]